MSISVEAAAARDSLSDDKELIHTYEVIILFLTFKVIDLHRYLIKIIYTVLFNGTSFLCFAHAGYRN